MLFLIASQQADFHATVAALVVGLVIGVFGHIVHSKALIIIGILIIGLVSAYFSFVLQPGAG